MVPFMTVRSTLGRSAELWISPAGAGEGSGTNGKMRPVRTLYSSNAPLWARREGESKPEAGRRAGVDIDAAFS
jgi:hypothetical protein